MATKSASDHGRPDTLTIRTPDDFHHHFRDEPVLADTVQACSAQFRRAIAMPNLVPPVTTVEAAAAYRERILGAAASRGVAAGAFEPLMTLYLTDSTTPEQIKAAHASGIVKAVKLYPAGATTNSASGVTDYAKVAAPLAAMGQYGLPLCVHGEVTDPSVDVFDRESNFISERLPSLLAANPGLRVIVEHMTTKEAIDFVLKSGPNVGGTITPQHLLVSRNAMLVGGAPRFGASIRRNSAARNRLTTATARRLPGIKPHLYCLPILKREEDRQALLAGIRTGCDRLFLGTDSAPHAVGRKESACGCAGVFSAHCALELCAARDSAAQFWRNLAQILLTRRAAPPAGTPRRSRRRGASTTSRRSRRPTAPTSTGYP